MASPDERRQVNIDELLARVGELPPLPQVAQKALSLIRNPDSRMSDLADVLSMDQAMAGLVLRWANSAYFGLRSPVATVQQAVVYLGQNSIQSLVLAASIAAFIDRPAPGYGLERGQLWIHSIGIASAARLLTTKFGRQMSEEAYHAGLLADIGKLAFESLLRDVNLETPEWKDRSFSDLESQYFGIDHAVMGAEMARRWRLPEPLVEAIACHHQPSRASKGLVLASAVHIADIAMMMMGIGLGRDGLQYTIDPVAIEKLGFTEDSFGELVARVAPFVAEAQTFTRQVKK
jgi:putative nucleotidyltransferase with HDIG domain